MKKLLLIITLSLFTTNFVSANCLEAYRDKATSRTQLVGVIGTAIAISSIPATLGTSAYLGLPLWVGGLAMTVGFQNKFDRIAYMLEDGDQVRSAKRLLKRIYKKTASELGIDNDEYFQNRVKDVIKDGNDRGDFCRDKLFRKKDVIQYVLDSY